MVESTALEMRHTGNRIGGSNPSLSATCFHELVLSRWPRPDFSVVFEGYAGWAIHHRRRREARKRSLGADILWTC